jgi:hypothetical protein
MRTKTLLLSGVVAALSGATVMAQVYSLNAVGYINVTVPPTFSIIANQLNTTNNNVSPLLDGQLLNGGYPGVEIFKYSPTAGYTTIIDLGTTWSGPATTTTMNPGEAIFIYNPFTTNITITFVGTVLQGSLTNTLAQNFNLASSIVPQSGPIDTALGLTPFAGDEVFLYDSVNGYSTYIAITTSTWSPSDPSPAVGQGFFYYTPSATGESWVRTFNVN